MEDQLILDEQKAYYRARAHEYDEWFLRQGRYDRGPEHRDQWLGEAAEIEAELRSAVRGAEVLELACGTGLWTQRLAEGKLVGRVDDDALLHQLGLERVVEVGAVGALLDALLVDVLRDDVLEILRQRPPRRTVGEDP